MASVKQTFVQALPLLEYAVASVPLRGQVESGDQYLVKPNQRGVLVAVIDGSGHGPEAASAAQLAVTTIEQHPDEGVIALVRRCHQELKGTRGAVMSLVSVDRIENTLTWIGVGNIEGVLLRGARNGRPPAIFLRPGVVGYRLPALQAEITPIAPGDLLILTTDGIRSDFTWTFGAEDQPSKIAEYISSNFHKEEDDGLVLVARYLGWDK